MDWVIHLAYLLAAALFVVGLKLLSRVKTARRGNTLSAVGMLIAIVATLIDIGTFDWTYILAGALVGSAVGALAASRVPMTAMPQMVALFNGLGGGASLLVAYSYFHEIAIAELGGALPLADAMGAPAAVSVALALLIGGVTLTGSLIAYAKLQELVRGEPLVVRGQHILNLVLLLGTLAAGGWGAFGAVGAGEQTLWMLVAAGLSLVLGVLLVMPIGGADMPVVISLLNSYSGLAALTTGFVVNNNLLIITGSLVGASGIILTRIMCKAMNRSLANVLFGGFGAVAQVPVAGKEGYTRVKSASPEEAASILETARSVVMVPGYGLAVAQAQHAARELGEQLEKLGATVRYAIHPVAGRMPGHMNVLLAEADVPYEKLVAMDQINPEMASTDVAIVLGANDVVNPAALSDPTSPIFGMPIINVHEAQTVFVVKRSLAAGFAGIRNDLFENDNTLMLFGDAKKVLTELVGEVKQLGEGQAKAG